MDTSQPSSAAAEYPRWVMFDGRDSHRNAEAGPCPSPSPADSTTVAYARTSTGYPVHVSFSLAAPPAVSRLNLHHGLLPDGAETSASVIAAHGDSVLICVRMQYTQYNRNSATDYFVYNAGDPSRPPSLSLLPTCYIRGMRRYRDHRPQLIMDRRSTGIIRNGDRGFVVAAIRCIQTYHGGVVADLRVLRSRDLHWKIKRLYVHHDVNKGKVISYCSWGDWVTNRVIPVGDRFFYWVDISKGIVFSDMSQETPELRFVPLPVEEPVHQEWDMTECSRSVCSTDGGATVKFVHVSPRCCCGGPSARTTECALSRHAFTITTWTLRRTKRRGMGWEKDAVVHCSDLWDLDAYRLLPRLRMDFPIVSIDDANVVCFLVSEHKHLLRDGDKTTWVVMVDTRRKTLLRSAILYSKDEQYHGEAFLPSQVSSYFNTSPHKPQASESRRGNSTVDVPLAATKCVASPDQDVLTALLEIPGLTNDEMSRAYGVLASDDRRRYQSLMALPMDMRKDYCCMLVDIGTNKQSKLR